MIGRHSKEKRHDRNECNKRILLHMPELAWRASIRSEAGQGEVRESCTSYTVQYELPKARCLFQGQLPRLCSLGGTCVKPKGRLK